MASTQEATRVVCQAALKAKLSKRRTFVERWKRNTWQTHLRELLNRSENACEGRAAEGTFSIDGSKPCRPRRDLPETDALTYFEEELLSPIQHLVRIFTLRVTGQCELRGHVGNLFQNGPQFVREIPAAIGDMKMLLIRRCPKDPHRKQRVPFPVSALRLGRGLDRLAKPVEEGGSLALRPGGLTLKSRRCIFFLLTFAQLYLLSSDSTSLLCFASSDSASLPFFFNCPYCRKLGF